MAASIGRQNERTFLPPLPPQQPLDLEREPRFTTTTPHHERLGEAGEGSYTRTVLQEERTNTRSSPAGASPTSPPTTSHAFSARGKPASPHTSVPGGLSGPSQSSAGSAGSSAKNGYGHEESSINVNRHVNASANPHTPHELMGEYSTQGHVVGNAGGVRKEERSRVGAANTITPPAHGNRPAANVSPSTDNDTNDHRNGGNGGVSAGLGAGTGSGNVPTVSSFSTVPTTTSSSSSVPRSSASVHTRRVEDQFVRRPSLASPLPPTPLVPSSTPQRFPTSGSSTFPDPLTSASPALTPPRTALGSTSSSTTSSPAQNPALQARNVSRSLTSTSSTPLSTTPSYTANNNGSSPTTSTSHPSLSRPLTAPSSPLATTLSVRPDSPSTAMMMKRLLSKPAPVGHGYHTQSGSESETFSGLAGVGAGGYTRRTKEAFGLHQHRTKTTPRAAENSGGAGPSFMDIEFDVKLDALDDRIATLGDWGFSSSPPPPGAVRIGSGMDTPEHRSGYKKRLGEGTPGSSPGYAAQMYRLANGSGSASGHGHGGSSSSSPVHSAVWIDTRDIPLEVEKGKEKEKKEKRKPNVLRRKTSMTTNSTSRPPPSASSAVPAVIAQTRLPPQPNISPISLSPVLQSIPKTQNTPHSPPHNVTTSSIPTSPAIYPSPSSSAYTQLQKIRPLPKPPSPTLRTEFFTSASPDDSNIKNVSSGPDDSFANLRNARPGPGEMESNEMLRRRLRDQHQQDEHQSMEMDGRGLGQTQHQLGGERHGHSAGGGKQGQSGGTYHQQQQQRIAQEGGHCSSTAGPLSRSRSMIPANSKTDTTTTSEATAAMTPATHSNKSATSIHRSASASATISSASASSSRLTKPVQTELLDEAFREYQREYQLEYLRFRAETAGVRMNAITSDPIIPATDHVNGNTKASNTLHPPTFTHTRSHSPSRSTSPSPSPSRSAFSGLSRSMSLAGSSVGSSMDGRSLSRDSNRHCDRERTHRSPVPSPLPSPRKLDSEASGFADGRMEKTKLPKSPIFFGVAGFGRDGSKGRSSELDEGKDKPKRGKDKEKERGRAKVPSATPAASFIEAYKRQERERDELARIARGEDVDGGSENKGQQRKEEEEEGMGMSRYRAADTDARIAEQEKKQRRMTGYKEGAPLVPNRRHSVSLSSSLSLSAMATGLTPAKKPPTTTVPSHSATTATPARVTIRRNITVDGTTVSQRKSGFSFASGWTTDSGIDLDVGRRLGEMDGAGGSGGRGFDAIERYMNGGGGAAGHVPSASASTTTTTTTMTKDLLAINDNLEGNTATVTSTATSTPSKYRRSSSTPATTPETRPNSADVAPYYTVFGSTSGRVVAVGSKEDAWAVYEQGRVSTSASVGERGKEKGGLGRTLSKKVSGRWKKQNGGAMVFEHGRASMQHDAVGKKKTHDGKSSTNRRSLRLSIEKMPADDSGVVKVVNGGSVEDWSSRTPLQTTPAKDASPGSGNGGGRFWKLMKRISIGGGLRDRYQEQSSSKTQDLPPLPPLPNASANSNTNRVLHSSRSIDSSLRNGRTGMPSAPSTSSSPGLPSSSRPSLSSSLTASTKHSPLPPLPPPPVPSSSLIGAGGKAISRSLSANSSSSSLAVGTPPPPPAKSEKLQQHILSPGQLRNVHSFDDFRGEPSDTSVSNSQQPLILANDPLSQKNMSINIPPQGSAHSDDWTIARSPSVEISSLPLPPRRFMAPQNTGGSMSMTAAAHSVAGLDVLGNETAEEAGLRSGPRRRKGVDDDDGEDDRDEDGRDSGSESPTIPSFSTSEAFNSFPSRRASASLSHRSKNSPAVSPVGGGQSPLKTVSPTLGLLPPPPRPVRSSQRPAPGTTPSHSQPLSSPSSSPNPVPSNTQTEPDNILSGRKSESHLPSAAPSKNMMHHRRSSGGLSTITIKAFSSQRRSSSFGVGVGYSGTAGPKENSGSPVFGTFGKNSAHLKNLDNVSDWNGKKDGQGETKLPKFALTEQEKAAKWADLLERSERAGGTLRVDLGVGV